ncbi:MAG: MFS transporter [Actinobacteria bacterium]|nr:MFS transporter [Actinomycetota bacterium]
MATGRLKSFKKLNKDVKIIIISVFLFALGYSSISAYIPLLLKQLGAKNNQVGLVYSTITGSAAISALIGGLLLSRFEIRKYTIFTTIIIAPFALIFYYANSWKLGIIAGLLDGISYASAPAYSLIIYLRSKKSEIGYNFGLFSSAFSAGAAIAPTIGGFLARNYGIRAPFLFSFVMLTLSSLVCYYLTPHRLEQERIGVIESFKKIFKERSFARILFVFMVLILFETAYDPFVSIYLNEIHRINYQSIGLLVSLVFSINFFTSPYIGMLADKKGSSFALGTSLIGYGTFLILFGFAREFSYVLIALAGIGIFKQIYTLSTIAASRNTGNLPPHIAYANLHFLRTSLSVFGPTVGGFLANYNIRSVFYGTATVFILFGLASFIYHFRKNKLAI